MLKTYKQDWDGIGLKISERTSALQSAKNTITDGGSTVYKADWTGSYLES